LFATTIAIDLSHFAEVYERSLLMMDELTPHQQQKLNECLERGDDGLAMAEKLESWCNGVSIVLPSYRGGTAGSLSLAGSVSSVVCDTAPAKSSFRASGKSPAKASAKSPPKPPAKSPAKASASAKARKRKEQGEKAEKREEVEAARQEAKETDNLGTASTTGSGLPTRENDNQVGTSTTNVFIPLLYS
jgi:hypothetical protein